MRPVVRRRRANPTLPRRYLFWLAASLSLASTHAVAQSTQVVGERSAAAQGIFDAVRQNDKDLIDREVFGNLGGGAKGATIGIFPTGRLRSSSVAQHLNRNCNRALLADETTVACVLDGG